MGLQFFPHLRDQCVLLNARGKVDGARTPKRSSSACVYDEQAKCARYYVAVLKANSVRDQLRRHEPFQFFTAAQHSIQRFFFGQCDDDYVALFFFVFASFILVEYHGDETNDGHLFRWAAVLFTAICSFIRVNHLNWNGQKQTEKRNGGQACSLLHNTTRKRIGGWFVPKPFYVWFELRYACKQRFELDVRRWTQQINRLNGKSKKGKQALRRHCDDNNNNKSNANKKQQTQQQWSQRNHLTLSFVSND